MEITVLRYGHRHVRDFRVSSHCCLVARAFGANKIEIIGEEDGKIEKTLEGINSRWGRGVEIEFYSDWRERVKHYKSKGFKIVHLTMYGTPLQKAEKSIMKSKKILVIIGSQKVEREVYEKSDFNVSVTLQPHSEIAALAVFLDRVQQGKELGKNFPGAKIMIKPSAKGKNVIGK